MWRQNHSREPRRGSASRAAGDLAQPCRTFGLKRKRWLTWHRTCTVAGVTRTQARDLGGTRRPLLLALVLVSLFPDVGHAENQEELVASEVYCEEAAAQLKQCCGALPDTLHCSYRAPSGCSCTDCEDPGSRPQISQHLYERLDALSCATIVDRGYCEDLLTGKGLGRLYQESP
jgi:hypothetical protein